MVEESCLVLGGWATQQRNSAQEEGARDTSLISRPSSQPAKTHLEAHFTTSSGESQSHTWPTGNLVGNWREGKEVPGALLLALLLVSQSWLHFLFCSSPPLRVPWLPPHSCNTWFWFVVTPSAPTVHGPWCAKVFFLWRISAFPPDPYLNPLLSGYLHFSIQRLTFTKYSANCAAYTKERESCSFAFPCSSPK